MLDLHEPNTFELFRQLLRPGTTEADIGTQRGYVSVFLNDLVGDEGLVHAFEPAPETFTALERAQARNKSERVIVILDADYTDLQGIWGTVLGIPRERPGRIPSFDPRRFQRYRLGQCRKPLFVGVSRRRPDVAHGSLRLGRTWSVAHAR